MLDLILEEKEDLDKMLTELPENTSMYKCHNCKHIFDIFSNGAGVSILIALSDREHMICPECKSDMTEPMCKVDCFSTYLKIIGFKCREGVLISGVAICPVCKSSMCPKCMNHSVVSLSRVTGYLQDTNGWNAAKKQELYDRKRYDMERPKLV